MPSPRLWRVDKPLIWSIATLNAQFTDREGIKNIYICWAQFVNRYRKGPNSGTLKGFTGRAL